MVSVHIVTLTDTTVNFADIIITEILGEAKICGYRGLGHMSIISLPCHSPTSVEFLVQAQTIHLRPS